MLQRWTLSFSYMHHFFAHFSEWLLGRLTKGAPLWTAHMSLSVHVSETTASIVCVCVQMSTCPERLHVAVGGVCVHACRMTFSEMWQREKKHLTHNWSAMKEIWSWMCFWLTCSAKPTAAAARGGTPGWYSDDLTALKPDCHAQSDTARKWWETGKIVRI